MDSSPSAAPLLDLIYGFRRSKVLFVAVRLGIFDGHRPTAAALPRLLDACTALGLLRKCGDAYENTELADRYLRSGSPQSLRGYVCYSDSAVYPLWEHLDSAVIEGTPRWERTFSSQSVARRRAVMGSREFMSGMHGLGLLSSPAIAAAFDLSQFKTLLDLGGATGHLAMAARERYPHLRIILFDTPSCIDMARECVPADVQLVSGDFTIDPLPDADLCVLGKILHHRSFERGTALLRRIYDALPGGGGVLIAEALLWEDSSGPVEAHMHSLNMLVCTDEGRELSAAAYIKLLNDVGFRDINVAYTGTPVDAILAIK